MKSSLLHDLANVFRTDADAIRDPYAWPPRTLTAEQRKEANRLDATASAIRYRAHVAEYEEQP